MKITPNSTITLYRGVEIDNGEQLAFKSIEGQRTYFARKSVVTVPNCQVVPKTGELKIALNAQVTGAVVASCNYLSFINPSFDNKTIYCRIIDYSYENNECVTLTWVLDYWQTWMFDVDFQDMYIEREHLSETDWGKANRNPYDTSIMEFKTAENLPVGEDIEKPYYKYGIEATDDGVYCAEALADAFDIDNSTGTLIIFSDLAFSNADGDVPMADTSSGIFLERLMRVVFTDLSWPTPTTIQYIDRKGTTSFFKISQATLQYIADHFHYVIDGGQRQDFENAVECGLVWDNPPINDTPMKPATNNTINSPVSYVFVDKNDEDHDKIVSELLAWFVDNNNNADTLTALLGIYPISNGLMLYSGSLTNYTPSPQGSDSPFGVKLPTAKGQTVLNKKLDLYPFSYYRLIAPNGDTCELRIESFKSAQDGENTCMVGIVMDITEKPNLLVMPVGYKVENASPHRPDSNVNLLHGLVFSQFPTLPYALDSFTMQMAAISNNIIANNTVDYNYNLEQLELDNMKESASILQKYLGTAFGSLSSIIGSGGSAAGIASGGFTAVSGGIDAAMMERQLALNKQKRQNEIAQSLEARSTLTGEDNAVKNNFKYTKPAYVCKQYHQINGDGVLNFNNYSFQDIIFMRVSINPTILEQYDNYFSNYGYSSGRCGIPRCIRYTQNSNDPDEVPHWIELNGKNTTYVKTVDCKVTHSMLPVAQFIKAMFDGGIRMIKGDSES